jgi:hypothetical protein
MTRKDYKKAAELLRTSNINRVKDPCKCAENILVELFASDNPNFDEAKFRAACSPEKAKSSYFPKPV